MRLMVHRNTMSSQAYDAIRQAILQGRYSPGSKLVVRPLAEELGLSPTPIKAALAALAREGLVTALAHHGHFVSNIDVEDVRDICALRAALDRLAAELAARHANRAELAVQLSANLQEQRTAVSAGNLERYADLNTEFHHFVWEASKNGRLIQMADNLLGQIRLLVNTSAGVPGRPSQSLEEHAEIARVILAGEAREAGQLAEAHARRSEGALLSRLSERGTADGAD